MQLRRRRPLAACLGPPLLRALWRRGGLLRFLELLRSLWADRLMPICLASFPPPPISPPLSPYIPSLFARCLSSPSLQVQMEVDARFVRCTLRGEDLNEIRVTLLQVLQEKPPVDDE